MKFRDEQIASHDAFLAKEGAVGYVDRVEGLELDMTMFQNGLSLVEKLRPESKVIIMPASNNLKVRGEGVSGAIVKVASRGKVRTLTVRRMECRLMDTRVPILKYKDGNVTNIRYAVAKDFSNFFPIPAEYGEQVSVCFSWEFDRHTLTFGAAELRDREAIHFVSVSPNDYLIEFVKCCAESIERHWRE